VRSHHEARPYDLAAKDRQLVAEHENLVSLARSPPPRSSTNSSRRQTTTYRADKSKGDLRQRGFALALDDVAAQPARIGPCPLTVYYEGSLAGRLVGSTARS
jgi:hypothetical protein